MDSNHLTRIRGVNLMSSPRRPARALATLSVAALLLAACASEDAAPTNPPPAATATPGAATPAAMPAASPAGMEAPKPATTIPSMAPPPPGGTPAVPPAGGGEPVAAMPPNGTPAMPPAAAEPPPEMGTPTIFWLDLGNNSVYRANADGSMAERFASGGLLQAPDGITVDPVDKHVFVLNMGGVGVGGGNNASLVRYNLDGDGGEAIIPPGTRVGDQAFNTGKQVTMDRVNRKLYMGDREGSKVWRSDMDGSNLEVLVSGHEIRQVVGVAADPTVNHFYFSDRNGKKLFRAPMEMKAGQTHADRDDLELLYVDTASNAMPLDLELDLKSRTLYWTDRQQDKVFAMGMDLPAGEDAMTRTDVKTVAMGLNDVIGLGYDHQDGVLFATHSRAVSRMKADGSELKQIGMNGTTGIAFVRIP
jgi:hypothetical protein